MTILADLRPRPRTAKYKPVTSISLDDTIIMEGRCKRIKKIESQPNYYVDIWFTDGTSTSVPRDLNIRIK